MKAICRHCAFIVIIKRQRIHASYQMADDAVRLIYDHLKELSKQGTIKIDLFLHS
ncbi:unnamed protein product, partial [marine sediment metagenome]